jgi:pentatricopeptide repeat protein
MQSGIDEAAKQPRRQKFGDAPQRDRLQRRHLGLCKRRAGRRSATVAARVKAAAARGDSVRANAITYNSAMRACGNAGRADDALRLLEAFEREADLNDYLVIPEKNRSLT